ncbi:unnamed protein product [Ascophyllum nodosum]
MQHGMAIHPARSRVRTVSSRGKQLVTLSLFLLAKPRGARAFAAPPAFQSWTTSAFTASLPSAPTQTTTPLSRASTGRLVLCDRLRTQPRWQHDHLRSCTCSAEGNISRRGLKFCNSCRSRRGALVRSRTRVRAVPEGSQDMPPEETGGPSREGQPAQEMGGNNGEEFDADLGDAGGRPQQQLGDVVNPFKLALDAGRNLRATLAKSLEQITGTASPLEGVKIRSLEEYEKRLYSPFDTEEEVPTVLVVGATGEMGRVVVRKLLLRGFAVRVLVRNLYSSTLDLLGTGATFAQGDLTNYRSIVDAVSGVDKVIFCAQARDPLQAEMVEYEGLRNLLAAFQDQRVALYGDPYSTKKTLFRFNRPTDRELWDVGMESKGNAMWKANKFGYGTFGSTRMYDFGYATVESQPINLNLAGFSGLAVRCCGDGKAYRVILRDKQYETNRMQFETVIKTKPNKWQTHRLSFSAFDAYRDGEMLQTEVGTELDRSSVQQLAVAYKRQPMDPFSFILSMHFVKVYRTQVEPEFIYVSSAGVPPVTDANYDRILENLKVKNSKCYYNARGEELLRQSGLTYTIIRIEGFNNLPGGVQALEIKQDPEGVGLVSRADAAEITVQCLLDPRACNLALYTTTSRRAPSALDPLQKMSTQLSRLRPNT